MSKIKKFVYAAVFTALAIVIGLIEIPFPMAAWLKLDLSDLVLIVSLFTIGLGPSLLAILARSIFRYLFIQIGTMGAITGLYAEGVGLLTSLLIIFIIFGLYQLVKNKSIIFQMVTIGTTAILVFAFIMVILNFLFLTPSFINFMGGIYKFSDFNEFLQNPGGEFLHQNSMRTYFLNTLLIYGVFNLIKGAVCIYLGMFVADQLNRHLIKRDVLVNKE